MLSMFLAAIDQTILAAAIPAIAGALGNFADVSWLASAYLIAATVTAPIYGHLGDRYGRRRMLFIALGIFISASIACSLANSMGMLILGRALQGLGGGGLMTTAQAMIGEHIPARQRGRFQGYFAALFAASSTLGPVLGGYLTQHASWRAVFLINLPMGLLAAWLATRLPEGERHGERGFHLDIAGTLLFAVAAFAMLFALSSVGHRFAWTSPLFLGLVLASFAALAALWWWELRAKDPVIPVRLLASAAIWRTNAMVLIFGASLFSLVLYLPLYLQLGRGAGIGESGMLLLPVTLTLAAGASITGRTISTTGHLTLLPKVGLSVSALAFGCLAVLLPSLSTSMVIALVVVGSAGLGTIMPTSQVIIQEMAGRAALGSATASISVSRSFGGALGSAAVGALLYALLGGGDVDVARILAHSSSAAGNTGAPIPPEMLAALTTRLETAYRAVFAMIAALAAAGVLAAWSVPFRRL